MFAELERMAFQAEERARMKAYVHKVKIMLAAKEAFKVSSLLHPMGVACVPLETPEVPILGRVGG